MSTILATEILQARRDAILATSKVLLGNSNHELRNSPINSKTLFDNKIREVAKTNFEAQQQKFLATSSVASTMQHQQKVTYPAPPAFKRPKQPPKPSRLQQSPSFRPKSQTKSYPPNRKEYAKRSGNQKVYDTKWIVYTRWCHRMKVNSISAPLTVIADFLIYLFSEKKYQINTIKGYRSMISNTLKFKTGNRIEFNPVSKPRNT